MTTQDTIDRSLVAPVENEVFNYTELLDPIHFHFEITEAIDQSL